MATNNVIPGLGYFDPNQAQALVQQPPPAVIPAAPQQIAQQPAPAIQGATTTIAGNAPHPLLTRPQAPTAPEGTSQWQQQRQQQLETEQMNRRQQLQDEISRQQAKVTEPWHDLSTAGKIGRIAGIAGGVMFPAWTSRIPGTPLYEQEKLGSLQTEADRQQQLGTAEQEAQAKMIEATTAKRGQPIMIQDPANPQRTILATVDPSDPTKLLPYTTSGQEVGPGAQPERERWTVPSMTIPSPGGPTGFEVSTTGDIRVPPELAGAQPLKEGTPPHITTMVRGVPHIMERDPNTGQYSIDRGIAPPTTGEQPGTPQPVPDPNDPTRIAGYINPKTMVYTPISRVRNLPANMGGGIPTKLTAQEQNIVDQARIASEGIPRVVTEIQQNEQALGPVMGRWNDFMQGRLGAQYPQFAGLRADLLMASSAVALAHARGRMSDSLRKEFDDMINAPKQDPKNMIEVLNHVETWMQRMQDIRGTGAGGNITPTPQDRTTTNPLGLPGFK